MRLLIITSNTFFGESLKCLLQDHNFETGLCLTLKDFSAENSEELDVIVSDYKLGEFKNFLQKTKI